ncbi:MAG: DEAD/DEAH box helicase, partial [Alphaproteobacteria bacterium]|nr:DEAD/DEAH box helicase [Alphaproteobacteria bacterium]
MRTEAANQPDSRPDLFRAGLPTRFASWFREKGWQLYPHQQDMLDRAKAGDPVLLIAPTGAGKTLSGFLPSLLELAERPPPHLHTLYISPLKALAVDIARNLTGPVAEMGLAVRIESRTGDTPANRRARQRHTPPHILLTTPESLELMLAWPEAADWFAGLQTVIIDEIHTLAGNKRGDLLSLSLAVLRSLAPQARFVGLSATLADPAQMTGWLHPEKERVAVLAPPLEKQMQLSVYMPADQEIPWAGHSCLWAVPEIYRQIEAHKTSLIFVNTRAQAEMLFQALWQINEKGLKIGLHHGSLATGQRRKTEAAMAAGKLDAVVATSSLDLGIDWAEIDLVMQVGAPKGTARLIQRMGRAGHQLNAVSRAIIFPANRFEIFVALAAQQTVQDRELERLAEQPGALDVLAQH